ncbi:hypothetical protein KDX31_14710 [Amphritea atlantica]|uniref:Filamentous hemagglutinin n=1 Tax=Amphritea atlantica TaxID=355243 RepID=A0ABY5GS54_9GAMM|nr:hypothetical protein KDX31_14710 [Amphritea atlantica]
MTSININDAIAIPLNPKNRLSKNDLPTEIREQLSIKLPSLPTPEERQAQIDYQNSIPQTTVIENNGEILAAFGDNGWKTVFSNNDVFGQNLSEAEILNTFKNKYGGSLSIRKYSPENAPTMGEIHEMKYGRPLTPKVDYLV